MVCVSMLSYTAYQSPLWTIEIECMDPPNMVSYDGHFNCDNSQPKGGRMTPSWSHLSKKQIQLVYTLGWRVLSKWTAADKSSWLSPQPLQTSPWMRRSPFCMTYIARGLAYLHNHKPAVIHRDLTARNVLLNSDRVVKISDFGNPRIIDIDPACSSEFISTSHVPGTSLLVLF